MEQIKYSDFIQPDDSIKRLIAELERVQAIYAKVLAQLAATATETEAALKKVNTTTVKGQQEALKLATAAEKLAQEQAKTTAQQAKAAAQLEALRQKQAKATEAADAAAKAAGAEAGSLAALAKQYAENKKRLDAMGRTRRETTEAGKELEAETAALKLELDSMRAAQAKAARESKLHAKLAEAAAGSFDALSAQYSLNTIRLNAMSQAEREGTQAGRALVEETAALREEMKRLKAQTGDNTLSVGDYENAWVRAQKRLSQFDDAASEASGGFAAMSNAAKAFLANPLVLAISAIVAAVSALAALFKRTKLGADLFADASAALSGILSALTGVVDRAAKGLASMFSEPGKRAGDFAESVKDAVTSPVESIKALGKAIYDHVARRVELTVTVAKSMGAALAAVAKGDMAALKQAVEDAGAAMLEFTTGLKPEDVAAFGEAVDGVTSSLKEQAAAFVQLERDRRAVRAENRKTAKALEALVTQEELLKQAADDATKSFEERERLAREAAEVTVKRAELERAAASKNLGLINREIDLRAANGEQVEELLDAQLEAYKTLREAERTYLLSVRDNQKRESELKQDRLERDLDILIDGFDNQKSINERIIADDTRTAEERAAKLAETRKLFDSSFAAQIDTIQQFTGAQVDANDLINESDAVALNRKIRALGLSEAIEGRLLGIVRDRKTGLLDLAEAEKALAEDKKKRDAEAVTSAKESAERQYAAALENIEQQHALTLSEIELLKDTEAEKTRLRLEAERARLAAVLALNKDGMGQLSALQIAETENLIAAIDAKLSEAAKSSPKDIYAAVGLNLSDEKKQAIADSAAYAIGQLQEVLRANVEISNRAVQDSESRVAAAQSALDAQVQAQQAGYASNVEAAQAELALARETQQQALADQRKAQRQQALLDTLQQVSGLVTASAKIWGTLGFPAAIPALAIMWGSFAAAKVKAAQLSKPGKLYRRGGFELLDGKSHGAGAGKDVGLGVTADGRERRAEGGEGLAVFSREAVAKYGDGLPNLVKAINAGRADLAASAPRSYEVNVRASGGQAFDPSKMEGGINELVEQGRVRLLQTPNGTMEIYKNRRRIIRNG